MAVIENNAVEGAETALSPRSVAERASFQAFINGYLREVDSGCRWSLPQWQQRYPEMSLPLAGSTLIELRLQAQAMKAGQIHCKYWCE